MANDDTVHPQVSHDEEKGLSHTATGVTMSQEMFEKLCFAQRPPIGNSDRKFANPAALGMIGFAISASTFAMVLMGWGGASGLSPIAGIFFFTGPVLLLFSMVFSWVMGEFFPMMVQGLFTVFWLSFGVLQLPSLGLGAPYATEADPTGTLAPAYNAAIALYLIVWSLAMLTFFFFTLRLNFVFAAIFGLSAVAICINSAAFWNLSQLDFDMASKLQKIGGALIFVVALFGWYATFIIMAAEMRVPVHLPMGDLSRFWSSGVDADTVVEGRQPRS